MAGAGQFARFTKALKLSTVQKRHELFGVRKWHAWVEVSGMSRKYGRKERHY